MVGALLPARSRSPQNWAEDQHGEKKENAGDLKPDFAADGAEGLKEAAESASDAAGGLPCSPSTVGGIPLSPRVGVGRAAGLRCVCPSPVMAWPAARPATRTPMPSTLPMDSGLTSICHPCNTEGPRLAAGDPGYDGSSGQNCGGDPVRIQHRCPFARWPLAK